MTPFDFHLPTRILFGRGRVSRLRESIPSGPGRILIVTDRTIAAKTSALDAVQVGLKDFEFAVFKDVEENPSFETVEAGSRIARDFGARLVLGLGGGSPLDAAKGIAVAAANPSPLRNYVEGAPLDRDPLPLICLPTTSGTGSEVTPYAVFTDREGKNKTGCAHPRLFPSVALIDPELSYSMPPRVAIDTGLDVLAHAAEAFLSTLSFPLTDIIARQAIETVLAHLENAAAKIPEAMDEMSYAAMLAGAAIAHAGTILPHIMGYPLTVFHGVPHGRASAVMLVHVLTALRSDKTRPEKFRALEDLFAPRGGLEAFLRGLGVPIRLSAYGVEEGEIPLYAGKTIVKGDIKITPAALTEDRLVAIYRSAL